MKKFLYYLFLFIVIFSISFVVTYVFMPLSCDEVWLYGFSYNISKGMVIYRDFNVVTTPMYYFIGSLFVKGFGNYIISLDIFNAILTALIFLMMYRVIRLKSFIVFPLILIFYPNGYNLFALFWLMLILFLIERGKDNDILIGFILGLLFITKQNIGIFLLIPYLYYSKNRVKGIVAFLIPFLVVSVYLIFNDAFFQFIDYCFLGLFDFGTGNHYFDIFSLVEIFVFVYLIVCLFESKFRNKEVFYILMFQIMMYPLGDGYHFFVSFFPVIYYLVKNIKNIHVLIILFIGVLYFTISLSFEIDYKIHYEDDILYLKNCGDLSILMKDLNDYLEGVEYYYFTGYYGYLYKLYYNIPITKYDLWNEGNMGYKGVKKSILELDKICESNRCLFIVDGDLEDNPKSQVTKFYNYIVENYKKIDEYDSFYIYSNGFK